MVNDLKAKLNIAFWMILFNIPTFLFAYIEELFEAIFFFVVGSFIGLIAAFLVDRKFGWTNLEEKK